MMNKKLLLIMFGVFLAVFLTGIASAVCCEKTDAGAWCQDVIDEANCDDGFRTEPTACLSTTYCSEGTCVNRHTGECLPSPQSTCDPTMGGYWYDKDSDEVDECQLGCCLVGDGAALVSRVRCDKMASDYNLEVHDFREDVQESFECSMMASPEAKGACVTSIERRRDCDMTTRQECQDATGEFHEGFLCTAPELGTICAMTRQTTCAEGEIEVYFKDSCGNNANIYDASLVDDTNYWTYIKDPSDSDETCGVGYSNANSKTCGNCNYIFGSICGAYRLGVDVKPDHGDFVCRDLKCKSGNLAEKFKQDYERWPEHGEAWCSYSTGKPYDDFGNFEDAKPGQLSSRLYCYNGEVQGNLCDNFRNTLCMKNTTTGAAACVPNRWQTCFGQNNTDDCENEDKRDCKVVNNPNYKVSLRRDSETGYEELYFGDSDTGKKIRAFCVPKYPPALNFWDPQADIPVTELEENVDTQEKLCNLANTFCPAMYTKEVAKENWDAWEPKSGELIDGEWYDLDVYGDLYDDGTRSYCFKGKDNVGKSLPEKMPVKENWIKGAQNYCLPIGDCGVKSNYWGYEGYNKWKHLFTGDYKESSLP